MADNMADLVLEGGGVRGIGLVGAAMRLADEGYRFPRVAGTSAGAVVGAVIAALQHRGERFDALAEITRTLDYRKFRDRGPVGRLLGPLGFLDDGFSLLFESGVYEGDYLHDWMTGVLADLGVRTFGDLRIDDDPDDDGSVHHRYALVVTASDLSRQRFVRLPWDYEQYGLPPDEQGVADAVRASASIPFFFEPVRLEGASGAATLVDGGLLSNYPITMFDRGDGRTPRWPTIGVRLTGAQDDSARPVRPVRGPLALGVSLVETAIIASQAVAELAPCNVARSVFVDADPVNPVDFDITEDEQESLLKAGRTAAEHFLAEWDFDTWVRRCRGGDRE